MKISMPYYPNFVLIGAPKCGTSSLFYWLSQHPQIYGAAKKETFLLMDGDNPLKNNEINTSISLIDNYTKYFPSESYSLKIRLEATTHYLYQQSALQELSKIKGMKIGIVLREPASRLWSSFKYTQNNLSRLPKHYTFKNHVDKVLSNSFDKSLCKEKKSFFTLSNDLDYGKYINYLEPWVRKFGRDRVTVLIFDELKSDPINVLKYLCNFNGIDPEWFNDFIIEKHNETYNIKSQTAHKIAHKLNNLFSSSTAFKNKMKEIYFNLQNKEVLVDEETQSSIQSLKIFYEPFNIELESYLDKDLNKWMP